MAIERCKSVVPLKEAALPHRITGMHVTRRKRRLSGGSFHAPIAPGVFHAGASHGIVWAASRVIEELDMKPWMQDEPERSHLPPAVMAGLNYLAPTDVTPRSYAYAPPAGIPWESCAYELRETAIADARASSRPKSIDREGFALWDAPTAVHDFYDEDQVQAIYYPEARELALAATGARHAYVFDHLIRQREPSRPALSFGRKGVHGYAAANGRIHNDYTEASGQRRLHLVIPDPVALAEVRRYAIVNIWRSIKGPILDTPLALCDARTVGASDLVRSEVLYPHRAGEIYHLLYAPDHRWHYYSEMDRNEALVFKQYDSQRQGVARFVPHAAFDHPGTPANAPLRESMELRCLVVYE